MARGRSFVPEPPSMKQSKRLHPIRHQPAATSNWCGQRPKCAVFKTPFNRRFMLIGSSGFSAHGFAKKNDMLVSIIPELIITQPGFGTLLKSCLCFAQKWGAWPAKKRCFAVTHWDLISRNWEKNTPTFLLHQTYVNLTGNSCFESTYWGTTLWPWLSPSWFFLRKIHWTEDLINWIKIIPSGKLTYSYWKWPFILDLPIKNGGSFHIHVSLPEGKSDSKNSVAETGTGLLESADPGYAEFPPPRGPSPGDAVYHEIAFKKISQNSVDEIILGILTILG